MSKIRLLAERTSKQSAKGNTAKSILCGIIAQSSIKSVKTAQFVLMYQLFCRFLTLFIIHGRQNKVGWNTEQQVIGAYCGCWENRARKARMHPLFRHRRTGLGRVPKGVFPAADAVDGSGCHQHKQQQGRLHRGDSSGAVVGISQSGYHYFLFGGYEGRPAFVVYDPAVLKKSCT